MEKMGQELKGPRGLPWPPKPTPLKGNDHRGPTLRWSLLILIMELRKNGLEVRGINLLNFYLICRNIKGIDLLGNNAKNGKIKF
jgi:hypothetical protein